MNVQEFADALKLQRCHKCLRERACGGGERERESIEVEIDRQRNREIETQRDRDGER